MDCGHKTQEVENVNTMLNVFLSVGWLLDDNGFVWLCPLFAFLLLAPAHPCNDVLLSNDLYSNSEGFHYQIFNPVIFIPDF